MPTISSPPPSSNDDLNQLINSLIKKDRVIFDPQPFEDDSGLDACGKCAVCGVCGECGKSAGDDKRLQLELDILRSRIEKNPEILTEIKKRWQISTPRTGTPGTTPRNPRITR